MLNHTKLSSCTIYKKLKNAKTEKSPGVDNFYPVVLCNLASVLSIPLCSIYQQSIKCNVIPEDWKLAEITPLFKEGSRGQRSSYKPISYKPISLKSVCCEVLESILKDDIMEHLECSKLINDSQHGSRSGRSCATNLFTFLEDSTKIIDEGGCVDLIYLVF